MRSIRDRLKNVRMPNPSSSMGDGENGGSGGSGPAAIAAITSLIKAVGLIGGIAVVGYNSIYTVPGGHRAIMFSRLSGLNNEPIGEGTHFLVPWLEHPIIFDVKTKPRNVVSLTGTRDLQMVNISVRVLSRPSNNHLAFIYRRLGSDYDERVLPSIVNEVCKQVIAQFNAAQLLTQREQVSRLIRRNLVQRAEEFKLVLDDVSITNLTFGNEFMAAVERKQVAQQEAERARFMVDKALQDKRSIIIKSQGEAKSAELIGKAIANNPGFLELRRIDAARSVAKTIASSQNKIFLASDTLMLNLMGEGNQKDFENFGEAAKQTKKQ